MCGFVGFTTVDYSADANRAIVKDMADRIAHRGPDDEGFFVDDGIAMGFRRLSIIDLEGSRQPMQNASGTVTVTFNGEIYNFQELRAELEALGYEFVTNGDTETVVHGYEAWGTGVFEKLRGMFAIAIWDAPKKRLVCARDLFGIKPLYYQHDGSRLIYGSEIKAFLAHPAFKKQLNREMLPQYLCFEYMNDSQTMFKDVHKLLPGHFMVFEDGELRTECYYRITYKIDESKSLDEWADEINRVFDESVAAHEIADVEIGSFLSGGIDSSLAAYCMGQHAPDIKTFSVGYDIGCEDKLAQIAAQSDFEIKLNELEDATEFAKWANLPNYQVQVDAKEFLDIVPTEQYHMDEPLGAPSAIPLFFVSRLAREQVKVVQSGEGADELFGGYWIYHDQFEFGKYFKVPRPLRAAAGAIAEKLPPFHGRRFAMRGSGGPEKSYQRASMNYMWDEIPNVLRDYAGPCKPWEWCKPHFDEAAKQDIDIITQTQYVDMVSYMPFDICLKADKMSMSQSLELRVPFLDKKVLDVALQLPTACRVDDDHAKYALRVAASKLGFQKKVANMPKQPFITPLTVWLQTDLYYDRIKEAFTSEAAHEFFNVDYLVQMLDDHKSADFSTVEGRGKLKMMRIWNIYCFLCWYEVFFGESSKQLAPKTQVA
ncbi:asparagine synthase (glutamine-hydrolyzing) [Gordonibacter massiliensis (ex Traore et al. 2017)]|uniref:asparagine synthase (glutamine-hydrolyzing) n=1 Tax=Gordonibacter massiliensis (ex Traore et al. 2017) TaxID=1841863 RepID=A0A842J9M0_9ACTN|nr:asparagine synthase (glutamine-hydrolyzing) [Gordonibacter massiliensis (ex Traore et al. 2017)]MBC2888802.1 asparagine synthase (glutamine-hydrolyzing) [Gordonibacter massiliensis (ex Traore et al. 2017)]